MIKKTIIRTNILIEFSESELQELYDLKENFKEYLGKSKERLRANPNDYDALVDVNFYRYAIRRIGNILYHARKGRARVVEERVNYHYEKEQR